MSATGWTFVLTKFCSKTFFLDPHTTLVFLFAINRFGVQTWLARPSVPSTFASSLWSIRLSPTCYTLVVAHHWAWFLPASLHCDAGNTLPLFVRTPDQCSHSSAMPKYSTASCRPLSSRLQLSIKYFDESIPKHNTASSADPDSTPMLLAS